MFDDVRAVTVPFADESIARLLNGRLSGYYGDHPFVILNANEDVRETIAAALRIRHLIALAFAEDGSPDLLGGDLLLGETIRVASRLGEFSVIDLAHRLNLSPQAANNRLRALLRAGAVHRKRVAPSRGGKEFRYEVPGSEAA
jgi:DNA-binding transcriptional ArsR family regulator